MISYKLVLSKRKTLAIHVKPDGSVEVRGPLRLSRAKADAFVQEKADWIYKTQQRLAEQDQKKHTVNLSQGEVEQYKKEAASLFQTRCNYFAEKMGVQYRQIKVNQAKTRWGSCNAKGNLHFTFRLVFAPAELVDYVIVHELAHLKEFNHSPRFWAVVEGILPDYRERRRRLKAFGQKTEWHVCCVE